MVLRYCATQPMTFEMPDSALTRPSLITIINGLMKQLKSSVSYPLAFFVYVN
jgi:hypothetical protein